MNVIATVRNVVSRDFKEDIRTLCSLGISHFRFNYAKCRNETEKKALFNEIEIVRNIKADSKIMLDIPYPRMKFRGKCLNEKMPIYKNKDYFLLPDINVKEEQLDENEIVIKGLVDIRNIRPNDELPYDMGQGCFYVLDVIDNRIKVCTNSEFVFRDTKTINIGSVKYFDYEMELKYILENIQLEEIAFSFVESEEDLEIAFRLKDKYGFNIVSKVETVKGIYNMKNYAARTDIFMLGRGDLGLDMKDNNLLKFENQFVQQANECSKKCYIATDILSSMTRKIFPSRGDIIDLNYINKLEPEAIVLNANITQSDNINYVINFIDKA